MLFPALLSPEILSQFWQVCCIKWSVSPTDHTLFYWHPDNSDRRDKINPLALKAKRDSVAGGYECMKNFKLIFSRV